MVPASQSFVKRDWPFRRGKDDGVQQEQANGAGYRIHHL
jgi:hypothetical protein